ncbi:M20/M25/M40 family metallo-hydrolase [Halobacillus locisalis]|uniref:M20/M25/M40 family metallo-hydrolase n=1 Tax=Halobacillus locisalis TaxID=220753 RepID=A0A838CW84_9BACI|nr:M20/M25/M40 family metallo-hydrolase [Halobacillus locisalis]MBA2176198.1 M20/M25/M40 family metallo-hydrolase [Halobacillus locisalis]
MKTWNRLFIRQGFDLPEVKDHVFDTSLESEGNLSFLFTCLEKIGVDYAESGSMITILDAAVDEERWLEAVDVRGRGRTESMGSELIIRQFDTYISGLVKELNRLGLPTIISCDGHDRRTPHIGFVDEETAERAENLIRTAGRVKVMKRRRDVRIFTERGQLLDLCELLHSLEVADLEKGDDWIQRKQFETELERLLQIDGVSGDEDDIRAFVKEELTPWLDQLKVDDYGNLMGRKAFRSGNGPTILLNAHLDTARSFCEGRRIVKEGAIWRSSAGILGADDRAGLAVLLETLKRLHATNFNGTVKILCTVEEEVGLLGARHVDESFLWDVDAAFVLDRRGSGDIVTSCGGYEPFCDEAFGEWVEQTAGQYSHSDWACTTGGSSDARIWASRGVQTVNLSVGYHMEHTDDECLDVDACYETVNVMAGVFAEARVLKSVLRAGARHRNHNSSVRAL